MIKTTRAQLNVPLAKKTTEPFARMSALRRMQTVPDQTLRPQLKFKQSVGNQTAPRAKLAVATPSDAYEQEADRVAEEVTWAAPGSVV